MQQTKELLIHYLKNKQSNNELLLENNSTYSLFHHLFIRINKQCKLAKKVTPHTIRRTRAIHLLDKGVNIIYIQELLGHENIITTQEYIKAITKSKFKAIENATSKINENLADWNDDHDLLSQLLNL